MLQLEPRRAPGGVAASLDLGQLYERMGAPGEKPEPKLKLGTPEEYSAETPVEFGEVGPEPSLLSPERSTGDECCNSSEAAHAVWDNC